MTRQYSLTVTTLTELGFENVKYPNPNLSLVVAHSLKRVWGFGYFQKIKQTEFPKRPASIAGLFFIRKILQGRSNDSAA